MTTDVERSAPSLAWKIANFVIFQLVYAACVFGAARGNVWIGPVAGLLLFPLNLGFVAPSRRWNEVRLWLVVGGIGLVADSFLQTFGVIAFPDYTRIAPGSALTGYLVPPWIVTLWIGVGTMLRSSLSWLRGRYLLAAVLGLIGGPFSVWSGERLGATALSLGAGSFVALGLEYAALMPTLLFLSDPSESGSPDRSAHAPTVEAPSSEAAQGSPR